MNYVLFIGSRLGYEALDVLIKSECTITHIFIEKEHDHEHKKYYKDSIKKSEIAGIKYSLNPNQTEIKKILNEILERNINIHYIMSFGYRKMISENVVKMAKVAALGTHFSPLPRYRGFAPLNWVLINGETETAVNVFYLDKEVDNGDIIGTQKVIITQVDDINTLFEKCLVAFRELMHELIPSLEQNEFIAIKQNSSEATYTCARNPEDGLINWQLSARNIFNLIRALTFPYPGAFTYLNGKKLLVWSCEEYPIPEYEGRIPGKTIKVLKNEGVVVLCGKGALLLKEVQLETDVTKTADHYVQGVRTTLGI